MDINDAVSKVEAFLEQFRSSHADWSPVEIRVLPSGDENDTIKIWINFGEDAENDDVDALADRAIVALKQAHPEVAGAFTLAVRADAA